MVRAGMTPTAGPHFPGGCREKDYLWPFFFLATFFLAAFFFLAMDMAPCHERPLTTTTDPLGTLSKGPGDVSNRDSHRPASGLEHEL